jgi:hypothetical protein
MATLSVLEAIELLFDVIPASLGRPILFLESLLRDASMDLWVRKIIEFFPASLASSLAMFLLSASEFCCLTHWNLGEMPRPADITAEYRNALRVKMVLQCLFHLVTRAEGECIKVSGARGD